jgi:hypothetical protein
MKVKQAKKKTLVRLGLVASIYQRRATETRFRPFLFAEYSAALYICLGPLPLTDK